MDTTTKTYRVRLSDTILFYVDLQATDEGDAVAQASMLITNNQTDNFVNDEAGYTGYAITSVGELNA